MKAGLSPNYALRGGQTVLLIAVNGGKTKAAQLLLEAGADPNVSDLAANIPLLIAAQAGNVDIVKALLAKHADPNIQTAKATFAPGQARNGASGEQTALLFAAKAGRVDVMKALVEAGANPKLHAQDGTTLLMSAAGSGKPDAVKYAYDLDPDIKAVTTRKNTVMHSAVTGTLGKATQDEICKVVQFLADHGAELDSYDGRGQTPIFIANIIPIDHAAALIQQLIVAKGGTPKVAAKK